MSSNTPTGDGAFPICPGPDPNPRDPILKAPAGACDVHAHVFGPASRYPYSPARGYTPPDASLDSYLAMHRVLGIERGVLTQPSVYGTDNSAMLDAVAGQPQRLRAVIAVDGDVTDAGLERFHAAGARGVRVNMVDKGGMPFDSMAQVRRFSERLAPLGWHLEVLIHVNEFDDLDAVFGGFAVDVVVGHLGYVPAGAGIQGAGFQGLLKLMADGRCWTKVSGSYRVTGLDRPPYGDVAPFARALIAANPERVLWGTDWPHPTFWGTMPNDAYLLDILADWTGDAAIQRQILVDNPARLYGFD